MQAGTTNKRIEYFDYLRIFATMAVIMLHVSVQNWYDSDVTSSAWQVMNAFNSLTRWAVPTFFMISGALFLGSTRTIETILKKNVLRILTAFVFWSALYAVHSYVSGGYSWVQLFTEFVLGHFHLWFLYAIVGLYLAIPILKKVVESDLITRYFLILAFVFSVVIPHGAACVGVWIETVQILAQTMLGQLSVPAVTTYAFYFVWGYYLHTASLSPIVRKRIYSLGIAGLTATILLSSAVSLLKGQPSSVFYEVNTLTSVLVSTAVFVYAKHHFSYGNLPEKAVLFLKKLSKWSFGAYLVHMMVMYLLVGVFHLNTLTFHPSVSVPLVWAITVCISFCVSAVLNRIPVVGTYIV